MIFAYAKKLELFVRKTEIGAQKVNGSCKSSSHPVPYHLPRKICVDSKSEINAIHPTFAKELGLRVRTIASWDAFWCQDTKIDGITLDTYGMVVAAFLVTDKTNRSSEYLSSSWAVQTSITTCSMEFAFKKKGNSNMSVTYKLHLDIKSSRHIRVIIISMSWPHPSLFIIAAHILNKSRNLAWASNRVLKGLQRRLLQDQRQTRIQW